MADKKLDIIINVLKRIGGLKDTREGVKDIADETDKTAKKTKSAWQDFESNVKKAHKALSSGVSTIVEWGKKLALTLAGAATGITALAIQSANFNKEIARASTMASTLGFRKLREEALKLSADLGVAKEQIADGIYNALSAGIPENNIFSFMRIATEVAVADSSEVATVVNGLSAILNAFNLDASKTQEVADAIFTTVSKGKTTFEDVAANIGTVASMAAATGVAYEQVLAASATLTQKNGDTARSMTQIRAAIQSITKVLGDDWAKKFTLQEAAQKVFEMTKGSQNALSEMLGSVEAMQGVLGIAGANAKLASEHLDAVVQKSSGVKDALDKVKPHRMWDEAGTSLLALKQQIGDVFNSTLEPLVISVTEKFREWRANQGFWDQLQTKLIAARETVANIWTAMSDGGQLKPAAEAFGNLIVGYFKLGMAEAVNILAEGIKSAFTAAFNPAEWIKSTKESISGFFKYGENMMVDITNSATGSKLERPNDTSSPLISVEGIKASIAEAQNALSEIGKLGETIRGKSAEVKNAVDAASGDVIAQYDATKETLDEYFARVAQMEKSIAEGNKKQADAVAQAEQTTTQAAETAAQNTEQAGADAQQSIADTEKTTTEALKTSASAMTTGASAASGQITGAMTEMGSAVNNMGTNVTQKLNDVTQKLSNAFDAWGRTIDTLQRQLEQTRAVANSAASKSDTALSQIKNMR